jgi:hypothetical protein
MFTVNANKYHVNTILIIFQAYLFTVFNYTLRNICDLSENGLSFVLNLGCIIVYKTTKIITSKKFVHNGPPFGTFFEF